MKNAITRFAISTDARSISNINIDSWQITYQGIVPSAILNNMNLDVIEQTWLSFIADTSTNTLVLDIEGEVSGYLRYTTRFDNAFPYRFEILQLYLKPEQKGLGYGKLLLNQAIEEIKKIGAQSIIAKVAEKNIKARSFMERFGFITIDNLILNVKGVNFDVVCYLLDLDN